jgi:hypothetical protein
VHHSCLKNWFSFTAVMFLTLGGTSRSLAENNPQAKALASLLKPPGLTAKADPQGLTKTRVQLVRALTSMQRSYKTGGPDGAALVKRALDFVPEVGGTHRMMLTGNLVQMWKEADALGCFDKEHNFTGTITRGPDSGKQAVFEHIVPLELAPRMSRDISNVRLRPPSKSRENGGADAGRDEAFLRQLKMVEEEITGRQELKKMEADAPVKKEEPRNRMGETAEEQARLFKLDMERAGPEAQKARSLSLLGRLVETPMKRNNHTWCYGIELRNTSALPTEVTVEWTLIGITEIKNLYYVLGEGTHKVQLRSAGVQQLEFRTPKPKSHYDNRADDLDELPPKDRRRAATGTKYRGAVIRVVHGKDTVVAQWGSDATMMRFLSDEPESKHVLSQLAKLYLTTPYNP